MRGGNFGVVHGLTVLRLGGAQIREEGSTLYRVHEALRPVNSLQELDFLLINHSVDFLKHGIEELIWKRA